MLGVGVGTLLPWCSFPNGLLSKIRRAFDQDAQRAMHRRFLKERDAFPKSVGEYNQQVERFLQLRRANMDAAWGKLEQGWTAINERMVRVALTPRTDNEDVIELNAGGLHVRVFWHLLVETEGFEDSTLGALLQGVWGEERIPRDADGRIVLDESPACIKHIIAQTTLRATNGRAGSETVGLPESAARLAVAIDEMPCLIYTAHVMGLPESVPTHPKYAKITGGSTVLEPFEIAYVGAKIREWVGGSKEQILTLVYRATRDGFDTKSFKATRHEDCPHTVSLLRVSSGQGNNDYSIVGGYSILPWGSGVGSKQTIAAETFLFMLKDGSATRKDPSKPVKWDPYPKNVGNVFVVNKTGGVSVGGDDLATKLDGTGGCTLYARRGGWFDIEEDSPFSALQGKKVVDIEVYRYSAPAPPTTTAPSTTKPGGDALTDAETHDIHSFGQSIASSLMEERVVFDRAVKEMEAADARVSAAVGALKTLYGPSVAAGEQDAVIELNVRGAGMTTLRSTLQACPRSALAAMFEDRWSGTDKDKDQHGRRLIDCDPTCLSKILDVLRMRKRASWSRNMAGGSQGEEEEEKEEEGEGEGCSGVPSGAVLIKEADVEVFGEAVNMYFPGCESFIMDLVQSV